MDTFTVSYSRYCRSSSSSRLSIGMSFTYMFEQVTPSFCVCWRSDLVVIRSDATLVLSIAVVLAVYWGIQCSSKGVLRGDFMLKDYNSVRIALSDIGVAIDGSDRTKHYAYMVYYLRL